MYQTFESYGISGDDFKIPTKPIVTERVGWRRRSTIISHSVISAGGASMPSFPETTVSRPASRIKSRR